MDELYLVSELQKNNGQLAHIVNVFTDSAQANYQFHYSAAFAAISEIEKHSVSLLGGNNILFGKAIYPHTELQTNMLYLVIEIQANGNQINHLESSYLTIQDAYHEFYRIASIAATSTVQNHIVFLLDEEGYSVDYTAFEHNIIE